jgi:DNA polymerase-3 subunit delta
VSPARRSEPPAARAAWLVEGEDPALVAEAVRSLVDGLLGGVDPGLAVEDFSGDEVDLAAVVDACQTPPFLADRRVVVLRDIGRFGADEVAPLVAYLDQPLDTTSLVFAAGDGRTAPRLVAAVRKAGQVVATRVDSRDARTWFRARLRGAPVQLDGPAEALVGDHLGEDRGRLTPLLEALASAYGAGARLGVEEVEPYLGEAGSVAPWDLTDAVDTGDTELALVRLHRLLDAGDRHPLVVLAILHRHVSAMLRVDGAQITSEAEAADALGIPRGRSTFPARKAWRSARRLGSARVGEMTGLVADAEVALKGGQALPEEVILEILVARLCRLSRTATGAAGRGRR